MKKQLLLSLLLFTFANFIVAQEIKYKTQENIPYYSDSLCKTDSYLQKMCLLDIYYPENKKDFATVVWFHGGGLTSGEKEIPERLKNQGFCVIGVGYRLSPKVKASMCIEDAAAAVAWVFRNIQKYGGNSSLIFVSGHSAGGYLTAMIGLDKKWLEFYGIDANIIAGLIPFSGQMITHFTVRKELGIPEMQPLVNEFAPLFYVRADAPPLTLITGDRELEMLGRYEENAYMMRMMKISGHTETKLYELQGYGHNMTEPAFPLLINEVNRISKKIKLKK
ncbi:Peptidase family S9-like protein [uncultured Paludibacter sp.]|nr:Peptidase family S9-like protein [uncultured Paludibacter sp.]